MTWSAAFSLALVLVILSVSSNGQNAGPGFGKSYNSNNPIVRYAASHSSPLSPAQRGLLETSVGSTLGMMTGAPEVVALNMMFIRAIRGRKALDVGLFGGFSALGSALAVADDGVVIGMDVTDGYWNTSGKRYAEQAGVLNKIDVRVRPAADTMRELINSDQSGTFDFCFIDADKTNYDTYYEQCLTLLRPGGVITIDNVLWGGRVVADGPKTPDTTAIDNLNTKIASDNRVWAQLLVIGDGLMVVVKK